MTFAATGARRGRIEADFRARCLALLIALALTPLGCRPDETPWHWTGEAAPERLPTLLDLGDPAEAARWSPGPAVAAMASRGHRLRVEPVPGATKGLHLSRELPLDVDTLGSVEVVTRSPDAVLSVVPFIRGRAREAYASAVVVDPTDPRRHVARFRRGRWNARPVDGLRIELRPGQGPLELVSVRVSSERYPPIAEPQADPDWPAAFAPTGDPRGVVLIVADTLRADHLSLHGYARATSPRLERLAEHAVVFEAAQSQAACTFPSVNSLLTSQAAASFLGAPARERRSLEGRGSLAERLSERGWQTWAVSASWVVRATESPHNDWGGGYQAGFDHFDESCADQAAGCLNQRAIERLDRDRDPDRPFFLYLHYMDPHDPYRPPPAWPRRFAGPFQGRASTALGDPNPLERMLYGEERRPPEAEVRHLEDLYDDEIRYLDAQIHLLFEALRQRGLLGSTLVILASDHGEAFLDHGDLKHCRSVFEDQVHTPLVFWVPGRSPGRRSSRPVENLDIVPTVLDYLGIPVGTPRPLGESLRPTLDAGLDPPDLAFSSQGPWQSVSNGRFKWVENIRTQSRSLFDLHADPEERRSVHDDRPEIAARLADVAEQRFRQAEQRDDAWQDAARQLEALGYLQ